MFRIGIAIYLLEKLIISLEFLGKLSALKTGL